MDRPTLARVLVVEDEEAVCELLTTALTEHDYDVACVVGDEEAYSALNGGDPFDVLVLDIDLGRGTTGFDIARYARRLNPHVPVLFISGWDGASVERSGVPGAGLITKPFDMPLLLATLKEKLAASPGV